MTEGRTFPTFCHIGEYDKDGYEKLHRMLAMSQPLILWAPTSSQLEDEKCRIPPRAFLDYVEEGRIRVMAREKWLTEPEFRDRLAFKADRPYPAARWDKNFDGELKRICEQHASRPEEERHVLASPKEGGWEWAEKYLESKPEQIARWRRIARSEKPEDKVPAGTLQAAFRYAGDDPAKFAQAILRDAYNHGDAIKQSGADVPFLLSATDRRFLDILGETADPERRSANQSKDRRARAGLAAPSAAHPPIDETSAELARQLLDLLKVFDIGAPAARRSRNLARFLHGDGHRQLVGWLSQLCGYLKQVDAGNLDNAVVVALQADLRGAELPKPLRDMIRHPVAASAGAIALATTVMSYIVDPTGALATTGLLAAAVQGSGGMFRDLGYIPASFAGPQWPFLYTYGSQARKQQIANMLNMLNEA
jgi:hypothetical protein